MTRPRKGLASFRHIFEFVVDLSIEDLNLSDFLVVTHRKIRLLGISQANSPMEERKGKKLLEEPWRELNSGFFDAGPIYLPVIDHPKSAAEADIRLRWMLDNRSNEESASFIWERVRECLPENFRLSGLEFGPAVSALGTAMFNLSSRNQELTDLLYSGRLGQAARIPPSADALFHAGKLADSDVISMMEVFWRLFDQQVACYRIFGGEFKALEQPWYDAESMTLSSFEKLFGELEKALAEVLLAFKIGKPFDNLSHKTRQILDDNGLERLAFRFYRKLRKQKKSKAEAIAAVVPTIERAKQIMEEFKALQSKRTWGYGLDFVKQKRALHDITIRKSVAAQIKDLSSSSEVIKYSAASSVLLMIAVGDTIQAVVDAINVIRKRHGLCDLDKRVLRQLTKDMYAIYREMFARPSASWTKQNRQMTLREHLAAMNSQLLASRSLEELSANGHSLPHSPYRIGPSPSSLLQSSDIEGKYNIPTPDGFVAKAIDSKTESRAAAVKDKRALNREAARRAVEIRSNFGKTSR